VCVCSCLCACTCVHCVCAEQRYFACLPMHGVFVRPTKVTKRDVPVPVEPPKPERVVKPAAAAAAAAAGAGTAAASKASDVLPRRRTDRGEGPESQPAPARPAATAVAASGSMGSFSLKPADSSLSRHANAAAGTGIRAVRSLASTVHEPGAGAAPSVPAPAPASKKAAAGTAGGVPRPVWSPRVGAACVLLHTLTVFVGTGKGEDVPACV
jgi:hypothetical protein